MDKIEYSRLIMKRSTDTGVIPTIPTGTTLNEMSATDLFVGEFFLNASDDLLWIRTDTGILPINLSGSTGSTIPTLNQVLYEGNNTNGFDIVVNSGDTIVFEGLNSGSTTTILGLDSSGNTITTSFAGTQDLQSVLTEGNTTGLNNIVVSSGATIQYEYLPTGATTQFLAIDADGFTVKTSGGADGTSGTSGINGTDGTSGTSGIGTNGTSGTDGTSGLSGVNGTNGTSGIDGTSGTDGTSGLSGVNGTSGSSGTSGVNGISAGRTYYFNQSETSDIADYKVLGDEPTTATTQTITVSLPGSTNDNFVQQFITPQLGFNVIPSGVQRFYLQFTKPAENDDISAYIVLQLTDFSGGTIGSPITSSIQSIGWNGTNPYELLIDVVLPTTAIDPTNRMSVAIYLNNYDATTHNTTFYTENGNYSFVITSVGVVAGTSGTSGSSGTSGINGTDGFNGTSGTDGTSGVNGTSGSSGTSGGGSVSYSNLTELPGQMVWNASQFTVPNSRYKVAGGLMYTYNAINLNPVVSGTCYLQTIILEPGETLTEIMFNIPTYTSASTVNIGLYNLSATTNNNSLCYVIGNLQHTISSGLNINSAGDKKITSINYTASANTTPNNVYAVCMMTSGAGYGIQLLGTNNLIPHIMGGELNAGTYYRAIIRSINGVGSALPSSLSSYSLSTATSPGWLLVYKTS